MTEPLDPAPYVQTPRLDVAGTVALGNGLIERMPTDGGDAVHVAADRLRGKLLELMAAWRDHEQQAQEERPDPRPADQRLDAAWGALYGRLRAYDELLRPDDDLVERARKLLLRHFPRRLDFIDKPYHVEWSESEERLTLIASEDEADVEELAGAYFLEHLREAHAEYGRVLGITGDGGEPTRTVDLRAPLREASRAIRDYTLQLVALATHEPERSDALRESLAPYASIRRAAALGETGVTPDTDVPPLPKP